MSTIATIPVLQQFEPCDFSPTGFVSDNGKRMCRLNEPRRAWMSFEECTACPSRRAGKPGELFPICQPPHPESCGNRLWQLRTEPCELCGATVAKGKQVPIYGCRVYGECATNRYRQLNQPQVCGPLCSDYAPGSDLPELMGPANLIRFVWPRADTAAVWQRQEEKIAERINQFDGARVLCIATDDTTIEFDTSIYSDVIHVQNDPALREMAGWKPLMERISREPGFTIWTHAKGAHRGQPVQHLQRWGDLAHEKMLDVAAVRESLQRHAIAGVFRRNVFAGNLDVPWHFSGSFYAFRNDWVFSREWMPTGKVNPGWYAEAWPALIAPRQLAACLAFDGCGDLYNAASWKAQ